MRILVDGEAMVGKPSGIGNYSSRIIEGIISHKNIDLEICVPLNHGEILNSLKEKVKIHEYGRVPYKYIDNGYYKFIKEIIETSSPDIFWEPSVFVDFLRTYSGKTKIVTTVHDIMPITNPEFYHFYYPAYFRRRLKKTSVIADMIMFVSEYSKREFEKHFRTNAKMKVVSPPISYNTGRSESDSWDICESKFTFELKPYLLFLGYSQKRKGIDILLDAYSKIAARIPHKLVIAGSSTKSANNIINNYRKRLKDKLIYLDYVSSSQRDILLSNCEMFLFPSRAEGFGAPPVEALIRGKKTVCSDIEVLRESTRNFADYFDLNLGPEGLSSVIIDVLKKEHPKNHVSEALISEFAPVKIAKKVLSHFFELSE